MPGMVNAIDSTIEIGNIRYAYMVSDIAGDAVSWKGTEDSFFFASSRYWYLPLLLNHFFPAQKAHVALARHDMTEYIDEYTDEYTDEGRPESYGEQKTGDR